MKRTNLNALVDALAFAGFLALASSGLALRLVFPPGTGPGSGGGGRGPGWAAKEVTLLWGMDKHAWENLHWGIALGVLATLAVHLLLHFKWIVCVVRGKAREGSGFRLAVGAGALALLIAAAAAPLLSPTETKTRGKLREERAAEPSP